MHYIRKNRPKIETQNQKKNTEVSSSENTAENSDDISNDLKTLRVK